MNDIEDSIRESVQGRIRKQCRDIQSSCLFQCEWLLSGTRIAADKDLEEGLDEDSPIYKAIMSNHVVQLGLNNPRSLLGIYIYTFLSYHSWSKTFHY